MVSPQDSWVQESGDFEGQNLMESEKKYIKRFTSWWFQPTSNMLVKLNHFPG